MLAWATSPADTLAYQINCLGQQVLLLATPSESQQLGNTSFPGSSKASREVRVALPSL